MLFEGSEKKVEILVDTSKIKSLRERPRTFWDQLVRCCGGEILSEMLRPKCSAFILSESSLFVWDHKVLILTCGQTRLVDSVLYFLEEFGTQDILSLIFQRKNEYYSYLQESTFEDDIKKLNRILLGKALRFGHIGEHHHDIFYAGKNFTSAKEDITTELLMYHVKEEMVKRLQQHNLSGEVIRKTIGIEEFLKDFDCDDYIFDPFGYSLNATKGDYYMALHITPQKESSYVSLETNIVPRGPYKNLLTNLVHTLGPLSFDLIGFNADNAVSETGFSTAGRFQETLGNYLINFTHFVSTSRNILKPIPVPS